MFSVLIVEIPACDSPVFFSAKFFLRNCKSILQNMVERKNS
jgi:hypothetical protein